MSVLLTEIEFCNTYLAKWVFERSPLNEYGVNNVWANDSLKAFFCFFSIYVYVYVSHSTIILQDWFSKHLKFLGWKNFVSCDVGLLRRSLSTYIRFYKIMKATNATICGKKWKRRRQFSLWNLVRQYSRERKSKLYERVRSDRFKFNIIFIMYFLFRVR